MSGRLILPLLAVFAVSGCASSQTWGWYVIDPRTEQGQRNLDFLTDGLLTTITLSITAAAISVILGLLVALPALSERRSYRIGNRVYVEFVRCIPLLPMLIWAFYGLPVVLEAMGLKVRFDPYWTAVLTIAISDSAFTAEIFRAGIQSIGKGQTEAAQTVGLNYRQTMQYVVLPQAVRRILPPLANQFVYVLKMSALASVIGVQELMRRANELVTQEYRALEIYTFLILEYFLLVLIISAAVRWLERRMGSDERG